LFQAPICLFLDLIELSVCGDAAIAGSGKGVSAAVPAAAAHAMVLIPTVKWAQRTGCVYLTIDVQDAKGNGLQLQLWGLVFCGTFAVQVNF
jgi:hypothetical protein